MPSVSDRFIRRSLPNWFASNQAPPPYTVEKAFETKVMARNDGEGSSRQAVVASVSFYLLAALVVRRRD